RQTGNKASSNRVARQCEDDRNTVCRMLCRQSALGPIRHNQIDLQLDELGCELISALFPTLGPAILDRDGMPLDPAEFAYPLHEDDDPLAPDRGRGRAQKANGRQLSGLPRPRRNRPRDCRAAEQRDELAPFHLRGHSMTSSAMATSLPGIWRPSALAVLRLMASSNFVGC